MIRLGRSRRGGVGEPTASGRLELHVVEVDTAMTEDDLAERVTETFGL